MKRLCLAVLFALGSARLATAGGIDISWNDCETLGAQNKTFACNSNTGTRTLVASFQPPFVIHELTGIQAIIDIQTADATQIAPWWRLGLGDCRGGSLVVDPHFSSFQCLDPWSGQVNGSLEYDITGNRSRITVTIREPSPPEVSYDYQYVAFSLVLDSANTIGLGACTGCTTSACLVFNQIRLIRPNAEGGDYLMCNPTSRNFATWQGGVVTGGCPGSDQPPYCQNSTAGRSTWGAIKSLYR